ncbi:MAG TPA: hypothetical protein VGM37_08305 [Armatimonadota bacterium]
MRRKHSSKRRGYALLAAMAISGVILALGTAMVMMTMREQASSIAQGDITSLRCLAEAGIDSAFEKLSHDPTWRCAGAPADFTNKPVNVVISGQNRTLGTFTVDPIQDLGGDCVAVTAHGYFPSATAAIHQEKQVRVIGYKKWGTPFSAAAFGKAGVPLANGDTDSYNSAAGSYSGQTPGNNGDIRTDSSSPGAITIYNQGHCNGRVMYGPGTDLTQVNLDRSRIADGDTNESNDIQVANAAAIAPDVDVPSTARPISDLTHGANSILGSMFIPAGTWWCNTISITGNSRVTTSGKVTLYAKGAIVIGGNGMVNNSDAVGGIALPSNLIIYGTPTCTSVKIDGNGSLTAAVYAPEADIILNGGGNNGAVYGALAGRTVSFNGNGTVLHYDTALQGVSGVVVGFRSKTWEEQ